MINRKIRNRVQRGLSLICAIVMIFTVFPLSVVADEGESNESKIIVSLGDSYSSGEGIPPFGTKTTIAEKVKDEDWLAHRSQKSWSSMLTLPSVSGTMADHRNENWYFTAVSGAETVHIKGTQEKKYSRQNGWGRLSNTVDLPAQLDIFDKLEGKKADYVTLTLGGNDAGFADIIRDGVVLNSTYLNPGGLADMLNNTWKEFYAENGIQDNLRQAYKDISQKAGKQATIIVAGYPTLLEESGKGLPVSQEEAVLINTNVRNFNRAIESLVNSCRASGISIHFVSVEGAFEGHEAYSDNAYINEVILPSKSEDLAPGPSSAYSIHPNEKGARAYAECVQAKLDELEGLKAIQFATHLNVSTLGADGALCGDYTIKITGREYIALWGLISKDYEDEIVVTEASPVQLDLPEGRYLITVTDGSNEYRQTIRASDNSDNNVLYFFTNFDTDESEDIPSGQFDPGDVLSDAVTFNGHWYKVVSDSTITSWAAAQHYCQSLNGYLATITSKEENDFLFDYITQSGYSSAYFGYADTDVEGAWVWSNGEVSTYSNWHSGEPNSENSGEDFGQFYYKYTDGTWNDGDYDEFVFICEWGEYDAEQSPQIQEPVRTTSDERDIVLVLDVSGSMSGTPMEETKKASTNFIETVLKQDASIGLVTYDSYATCVSDFSVNEQALKNAVSSIYSGGTTNIDAGLTTAKSMLENSNAKKKIIVLMSDGLPNEGREGDALISFADEIKEEGILIYTLGFFEDLGSDKSYAQSLLEALASDGCHYEVADADNLVFFFEDIADQINGTRYIYVRIACPVDVSVSYNGEMLNSAESELNQRTDFGTLTFEENENASANTDDRIKILRLKEGVDYDIQIVGTGRGIMDYTIGFMDEEGEYSDLREFENIKISKTTVIDTVASVSDQTILNVDEDGDGKYDIKYQAEENGYGEEIKTNIMLYVYIGVGFFILIALYIVIRKICKNIKKKAGTKNG